MPISDIALHLVSCVLSSSLQGQPCSYKKAAGNYTCQEVIISASKPQVDEIAGCTQYIPH